MYGGKTVRVKLEDSTILTLRLLLKVSPPLFVMDVGKEMFAITGNVYGDGEEEDPFPENPVTR